MKQLTPQELAKNAVLTRARAEGTIVRAAFLNALLPRVEAEFNRRLSEGEELSFTIPSASEFADAYVRSFLPEAPALS